MFPSNNKLAKELSTKYPVIPVIPNNLQDQIDTLNTELDAHLAESASKNGSISRDATLAGEQIISLPFKAKAITIFAVVSDQAGKASWGFCDENLSNRCTHDAHNRTPNTYTTRFGYSVAIMNNTNDMTLGTITQITDTGFTVDWSKVGNGATGTISVYYMATTHGEG